MRMDFDQILGRVLKGVQSKAFVTPSEGIRDAREREIVGSVLARMEAPGFDVEGVRAEIEALGERALITPRRRAILLQTVAAHPAVGELEECARLIGEEEYLVLQEGGPELPRRLAVVHHHRAVLAYLLGRYEVALDLETRSVEVAPWSDSLANILAILLRLGEEPRARDLLAQMRASFPAAMVARVIDYIRQDPDLELLRDAVVPIEEAPCDTLLH